MTTKIKILYLCTGNSCRSQMAEGWTRHLRGELIEAISAGTHPTRLDPRARIVMAEAGVDISAQTSKSVDTLVDSEPDYVVTVCDGAHEICPVFPGKTQVRHVVFADPPRLATGAANEEEALDHYRRVRDQIRSFVATLPHGLETDRGAE